MTWVSGGKAILVISTEARIKYVMLSRCQVQMAFLTQAFALLSEPQCCCFTTTLLHSRWTLHWDAPKITTAEVQHFVSHCHTDFRDNS